MFLKISLITKLTAVFLIITITLPEIGWSEEPSVSKTIEMEGKLLFKSVCYNGTPDNLKIEKVNTLLRKMKILFIKNESDQSYVITPLKNGSFFNNYSYYLNQTYNAKLSLDPSDCDTASAQPPSKKNNFHAEMKLGISDIANIIDKQAIGFSTLNHEESHIAHFTPKFKKISPLSPFLMVISSLDNSSISMNPYSNSFNIDEISSHLSEFIWTFSNSAKEFSDDQLNLIKLSSIMYLKSLVTGYCSQLVKVSDKIFNQENLMAMLQDKAIFLIERTHNIQETDSTPEQMFLSLQLENFRDPNKIVVASLVRGNIQFTIPLHNITDHYFNPISSSLKPGEFQFINKANSLYQKIFSELELIIKKSKLFCENIKTNLEEIDEKPDKEYKLKPVKLEIIENLKQTLDFAIWPTT